MQVMWSPKAIKQMKRIGDWRILIDLIDAELVIIRIEEVKKRDERTY